MTRVKIGRWSLLLAQVEGPSMVPTLHHGDRLVAVSGIAVRPGDVVLARFPDMPAVVVVKRAVRAQAQRWWLVSDNEFAGGDSRSHGAGEVFARVVMYLPVGRWFPRRLPIKVVG